MSYPVGWSSQRQPDLVPRLLCRHTEWLRNLLSLPACPHVPQSPEGEPRLQIKHRCALQIISNGFYRIVLSLSLSSAASAAFFKFLVTVINSFFKAETMMLSPAAGLIKGACESQWISSWSETDPGGIQS